MSSITPSENSNNYIRSPTPTQDRLKELREKTESLFNEISESQFQGFKKTKAYIPSDDETIDQLDKYNRSLQTSIVEVSTKETFNSAKLIPENERPPLVKIFLATMEMRGNDSIKAGISDDTQTVNLIHAIAQNSPSEKFASTFTLASKLLSDAEDTIIAINRSNDSSQGNISSRASKTPSTLSTNSSVGAEVSEGSDSGNQQSIAQAYREDHKEKLKKLSEIENKRGSPTDFCLSLTNLIAGCNILILGEGSHDQLALDHILAFPGLPKVLKENKISSVIIEHLYDSHLQDLKEADKRKGVYNHLVTSFGGEINKALSLILFINSCSENDIKIIAADKQEIYRPSGIDMNSYNKSDRVEALNSHILTLVKQHNIDEKNKALILVGSAHTNHFNAQKMREIGGSLITDSTAGLTEVLPNSQEIIITNFVKDHSTMGLSAVKKGYVFFVEKELKAASI